MQLSDKVKARCHADIDASNIKGLYKTLEIILNEPEKPKKINSMEIEFTLSQLDYLANWSQNTGLDQETIVRGLVDIMMKNKPELGELGTKFIQVPG